MKTIKLENHGPYKTAEIIRVVTEKAPDGVTVSEMRRRIRILDALDGGKDSIELEDADHEMLQHIVNKFPFAVANKELLAVIDGIVGG